MKVLIADDDRGTLTVLRSTLASLGHDCLMAHNGLQAWDLFLAASPDVIISDRMMPGIDGDELCYRVRNSEQPYTYFIFLTSLNSKENLLEGMRGGADDYLCKPLNRIDLEVRLIGAERVTALHRELNEQRSEMQRLNIELLDLARRDPLTQLWNRLRLGEDLEQMVARVERYGHCCAVAICDIDFFKLYNDHYGHLAGDEVLKMVADELSSLLRRSDRIYRYGGEEFLLLLPQQSLETGVAAVERMREAVEALDITHTARSPEGIVTISGGVTELCVQRQMNSYAALEEADRALYSAKRDGRNRVRPFCTEEGG